MPRKRKKDSVRAYFRELFAQHPDWLWSRSNELVLEQWKTDHPDQELSAGVKEGMSNVKSLMRREDRDGGAPVVAARSHPSARTAALELLEVSIDGALLEARKHPGEELASVIMHLRRARNGVVHELGEPGKD
jgi:hypothetical protein